MRRLAVMLTLALTLAPLPGHGQIPAITAEPVVEGLDFPAAFTVFPDGKRLLYGERFNGEIHVYNMLNGNDKLFFDIPGLATTGESGVLGLALHPSYPSQPFVFAAVTRQTANGVRHQIVRIRDNAGTGQDMTVIFSPRAANFHNGGRILFGPDRMLYFVVGDNGSAANSQALPNINLGKVNRLTTGGGVPSDNPIAGSHVFAYGIRNSFGLGFDHVTGTLWESENGPQCNDEINRIDPGANYGWGPTWTCAEPPAPPANTNRDGPNPTLPAAWYADPPALTGIGFCQTCGLGTESEGRMFVVNWNTGHLRRVTLTPDRMGIAAQEIVYGHPSGHLLSLERARAGTLYISDPTGIYRLVLS